MSGEDDERVISSLQAVVRGNNTRKDFEQSKRSELNELFGGFDELGESTRVDIRRVCRIVPLFIRSASFPADIQMLAKICRALSMSVKENEREHNFASVFLSKSSLPAGSRVVGGLCSVIPTALFSIKGTKVSEKKAIDSILLWMLVFSNCSGWTVVKDSPQVQVVLNGLCAKMSAVLFTPANYSMLANCLYRWSMTSSQKDEVVNTLFSILLRPVRASPDEEKIAVAVDAVMPCAAVFLRINEKSRDNFLSLCPLENVLAALENVPREPTRVLNVLANLIHLSYLSVNSLEKLLPTWIPIVHLFLTRCIEFSSKKERGLTFFHPVFGNTSIPIEPGSESSIPIGQLKMLWSKRMVETLFSSLKQSPVAEDVKETDVPGPLTKLWKKLSLGQPSYALEAPSTVALVSQLYMDAMLAFPVLRSGILSGICTVGHLPAGLWSYIRGHFDLSAPSPCLFSDEGLIHVLPIRLFADACSYLLKILDDEEVYEQGIPLPLPHLIAVAKFCNSYCFKSIWCGYYDECDNALFHSLHNLCMILHGRHFRRPFSNEPKFWLTSEVKSSWMVSEFERSTPRSILLFHKISHVVPLKERMLMFRKYVQSEKTPNGHSTMISVLRSMIVEDGYRQLARLSSAALRATIRVKFVNQQGLDEAGIDQDGVFKEFLELTLKRVFDPSLNLFCHTSGGQLYPSHTSSVHEDHLQLFRFVGKMLAKAVFEGIVVDVQLAPVLLATLLNTRGLCAFDQLAQLDPELHRSLSFVKKCDDDDIADLALTFSIDENFMGKISTVDIIPCGRAIPVTADNKIDYVHRMAHYRVFTQTKEQCKAFVEGFQTVVDPSWLFLFSPHELQFLISGQNSDIDIADLRRHVQYYGGFHNNHRLIKWLWQILEGDFSVEERRLFLKFVTSCSRAPLLGFGSLEPPFSIRCVEVGDDQDTGDTLGSVVRGFLALKKGQSSDRLPTASTCFNLLKLPNYNKKSTLLQKLRYAIHSETGFELS